MFFAFDKTSDNSDWDDMIQIYNNHGLILKYKLSNDDNSSHIIIIKIVI